MSEDSKHGHHSTLTGSHNGINISNLTIPFQNNNVSDGQYSPTSSASSSFENVQCNSSCWVKMSECDDFIGPKFDF